MNLVTNQEENPHIKPEKYSPLLTEKKLENVTKEMKLILSDIKSNLVEISKYQTPEQQKDSFSNVIPKIEEIYNKSISTNILKPTKKAVAKTSDKKTKKSNKKVETNKKVELKKKLEANKKPESKKEELDKNKTPTDINSTTKTIAIPGKSQVAKPAKTDIVYTIKKVRAEVESAKKTRKTFTVRGGYPAIRAALLRRGWVERIHMTLNDRLSEDIKRYKSYSIQELIPLLSHKEYGITAKRLIQSKLLDGHQVDLFWSIGFEAFKETTDTVKYTLINKFRQDVFSYTNKGGLCQALKQAYWYRIPGVSDLNHPRCYCLTKNGDSACFVKDFYLTAAMSLLKWVIQAETENKVIVSKTGSIPTKFFYFAITECYKAIKHENNEDIDTEIKEAYAYEWQEFLQAFHKIVHIGNHFKADANSSESDMIRESRYILKRIGDFFPCLDMDGMMNIWILKPMSSSQGKGIHICRKLDFILEVIKKNVNTRYVVQKYIEKPLLIYKTKFDIRQWFLISSSYPLTIWMYKDSYLRFSSQTYDLLKLDESIHLTNNSVQVKYVKKSRLYEHQIPPYFMWESSQFIKYLTNIGYPQAYQDIIYPGMQQCITASVLMLQEKLDKRVNCFELYGADFMITEDFKPWILEINRCPALHNSTPVTKKMCPQVLEEVIKVVVDYGRNPKASTGRFEQIYKQKLQKLPNAKNVADLAVSGKPITTDYFLTQSQEIKTSEIISEIDKSESTKDLVGVNSIKSKTEIATAKKSIQAFSKGMKATLEHLLKIVQQERQQYNKLKTQNKKNKLAEKEILTDLSIDVIKRFGNTTYDKLTNDNEDEKKGCKNENFNEKRSNTKLTQKVSDKLVDDEKKTNKINADVTENNDENMAQEENDGKIENDDEKMNKECDGNEENNKALEKNNEDFCEENLDTNNAQNEQSLEENLDRNQDNEEINKNVKAEENVSIITTLTTCKVKVNDMEMEENFTAENLSVYQIENFQTEKITDTNFLENKENNNIDLENKYENNMSRFNEQSELYKKKMEKIKAKKLKDNLIYENQKTIDNFENKHENDIKSNENSEYADSTVEKMKCLKSEPDLTDTETKSGFNKNIGADSVESMNIMDQTVNNISELKINIPDKISDTNHSGDIKDCRSILGKCDSKLREINSKICTTQSKNDNQKMSQEKFSVVQKEYIEYIPQNDSRPIKEKNPEKKLPVNKKRIKNNVSSKSTPLEEFLHIIDSERELKSHSFNKLQISKNNIDKEMIKTVLLNLKTEDKTTVLKTVQDLIEQLSIQKEI